MFNPPMMVKGLDSPAKTCEGRRLPPWMRLTPCGHGANKPHDTRRKKLLLQYLFWIYGFLIPQFAFYSM